MKNNTLEITVDGCIYQVVRIINNYDAESIVYICLKDDKYGVFSPYEEEMIIPFEYDNITYLYEGFYLLSKGGKMGLIHFERCYDYVRDCNYNSRIAIPCEYDFIHTLNSYGKAFILQKNDFDGISVQAYLPQVTYLTEEYTHYRYWNEGFLELTRENKRVMIDVETGDVISNDKSCITFAIYNTVVGTVIHELKEPDKNRLIFICECFAYHELCENPDILNKKNIIEFSGKLYVTYEEDECYHPLVKLFKIVHPDESTEILNNEGIQIE